MLNITILTIGKIKEKYFQEAIAEYEKRLSPYAKIRLESLKPEPFFDNSDKENIKQKEGEKIISFLEKNRSEKIFVMDERGKEFSSEDFSKKIFENTQSIVFVVGGSLGLSGEVLNHPGWTKISLSKMTFLHEMTQVILLEQIYRAVAIEKGKRYHY